MNICHNPAKNIGMVRPCRLAMPLTADLGSKGDFCAAYAMPGTSVCRAGSAGLVEMRAVRQHVLAGVVGLVRRVLLILLRAVPLSRFAAAADFLLAGREPGFHVAVIAAFGVGDGEQKSFGAVEKAQAQHVGAQE